MSRKAYDDDDAADGAHGLSLLTEFASWFTRSIYSHLDGALVGGDLRRTGRQRYRQRESLTCKHTVAV